MKSSKSTITNEFAKRQTTTRKDKHCAILPSLCQHCQSKSKHSRYGCRLCLFCQSNKLTFDLLILKVVSESRVTWATSVTILVVLGLSVLDLGPIYVTDRQTSHGLLATSQRLIVRLTQNLVRSRIKFAQR